VRALPSNLLRGTIGFVGADNIPALLVADVVAGAGLGWVVGRTVVRLNGRPLERAAGPTLIVAPIMARHTRGMQMSVTF
jgi:hypothetical protein